jgi:hypothetical protein
MRDPEATVSATLVNSGRQLAESFAVVATFEDEPVSAAFSVVVSLPRSTPGRGTVRLLVPDNLPEIRARFRPNVRLVIREGAHPLANCVILSVSERKPLIQGTLAETD